MKINRVVLFYLFLVGINLGQTISITGIVKNSTTGEALSYTNISVKNTNYGTVSNIDGEFGLSLDSATYTLLISYIGFESEEIMINKSVDLTINLVPVVYSMDEIIVSSLTWAEKFIINAINEKNKQLDKINHYVVEAYSKTTLHQKSMGLFGLVEAISEVSYLKPDLYNEKLLSYKESENMKVVPYEYIAINQEANLLSNTFTAGTFELISPLHDDALQYYEYKLKNKTLLDKDTVVVISVTPKSIGIPLLQGDLYFLKKNYQLLSAELQGNDYTKNAYADSLYIHQRYTLKSDTFNMPSFTKFSVRMSFTGFYYKFSQQYTFINYDINNSENKPILSADHKLMENLNRYVSLDEDRSQKFNVPLSREEIAFNEKVRRVFVEGSIFKKFFLFLFTQGLSTLLDQPGELFGYQYRNFANLYRFNRVEGHYVGLEYQLLDTEKWYVYLNGGYSFGLSSPEFSFQLKKNQLIFESHYEIGNVGKFGYLKNINTLNALFVHEDPIHYYKSYGAKLSYFIPLNSTVTFTPYITFKREEPIGKSTDFSFFNTDKMFNENYKIPGYNNNSVGFELSYVENDDYWSAAKQIYKGQSFTNISASVDFLSADLLNSTEELVEIDANVVTYQELFHPVSMKLEADYHHVTNTSYINKMSFINTSQLFLYNSNRLSFHTLENYSYYLQNYFRFTADFTLFNLPEISFIRPSVGGVISFLHPLNVNKVDNYFSYLSEDFYEYGIALKGITIFNLYFLKNNLEKETIYLELNTKF